MRTLLLFIFFFTSYTTYAQTHTPENFPQFYDRFHRDSLFQLSRVQFPLPGLNTAIESDEQLANTADGPVNYRWTKSNWPLHHAMEDTVTYKLKRKQSGALLVETIYIPDSDFIFIRKFRLIKNKWYLVYMQD